MRVFLGCVVGILIGVFLTTVQVSHALDKVCR